MTKKEEQKYVIFNLILENIYLKIFKIILLVFDTSQKRQEII